MQIEELDWKKIYSEAKGQLRKLDIKPEYVCEDRKTSTHGKNYSAALVTIRVPVRGHKKEIDTLMAQSNFCRLRGENANGVRYMCGWLEIKI